MQILPQGLAQGYFPFPQARIETGEHLLPEPEAAGLPHGEKGALLLHQGSDTLGGSCSRVLCGKDTQIPPAAQRGPGESVVRRRKAR